MIKYLKGDKGRKVGVIVAQNIDGITHIGMSFVHPLDELEIRAENLRIKKENALAHLSGKEVKRKLPLYDKAKGIEIAKSKMKPELCLADVPSRFREQVIFSLPDIIVHTGGKVVLNEVVKRKKFTN